MRPITAGGGFRGAGGANGGGGLGFGGGSASKSRRGGYAPYRDDDDLESGGGGGHGGRGNDAFIRGEHQRVLQEQAKQDASLDTLHGAVKRLGDYSLAISSELDEQNAMLEALDEDVEHAQTTMDSVTKKTKELIKKSGGVGYFSVIVCLLIVVMVLLYLIFFI